MDRQTLGPSDWLMTGLDAGAQYSVTDSRGAEPAEIDGVGHAGASQRHARRQPGRFGPQPGWYKEAIFYELHVRAFSDSSGDGIGDFAGLTRKLDYLHDLGVTALWLLPFYPSPWKDDGYDIADYKNVHPAYGSLEDFQQFLDEAHRRELKVITELVLNHTSDQHPWFERARRAAPGTAERDFYVWSQSAELFKEARVIFEDFESSNWSWDPVAQAYYWHRFFSHQPDLNYKNPMVLTAILDVLDFWMAMGVDGFRLDAVPYLVEAEGTSSENLSQTHDILKKIRQHVDAHFAGRVLLAEANQWPEEAAAYFGQGDECHMAFHFPLMPRLFMAVQQEDRFPVLDIFAQTPALPENCQWALFLRNHDELSLEMVTEEDRLFMYETYAKDAAARLNLGIRRRLAPLLGNDRRRIELMNWLLFTLPGAPIVYYGDEIGMGDNIYLGDRQSVRTPMQWSPDRNAGFSLCHPQRLYLPLIIDHEYHHESVHVEGQSQNPRSLLSWMKRLIAMRKRHPAFSRGSIQFLRPPNPKVLAYVRSDAEEELLVVANLSAFTQPVELDLAAWSGRQPRHLFGGTEFPVIGGQPYLLTLSPFAVFGFVLERTPELCPCSADPATLSVPAISISQTWEEVFYGDRRLQLEDALLKHLRRAPWLRQRGRRAVSVTITDLIGEFKPEQRVLALSAGFAECGSAVFLVPVAYQETGQLEAIPAETVVARLVRNEADCAAAGVLYEAPSSQAFDGHFLNPLISRGALTGRLGQLTLRSVHGPFPHTPPETERPAEFSRSAGRSLSNTTLLFGQCCVVKLFRLLEQGPNPETEIGEYLTARRFPHAPRLLGSIQYVKPGEAPMACGVIYEYVPGQGELWDLALGSARAALRSGRPAEDPVPDGAPIAKLPGETTTPAAARETVGPFLEMVRKIGRRTAALHLLLAEHRDRGFAPEPFTPWHRESLHQRLRASTLQAMEQLGTVLPSLTGLERQSVEELLRRQDKLLQFFRLAFRQKLAATRIRCHGNLHLGQVLSAGGDLVIIDFEGEPTRPVFERRLKRCPLVDLASMGRSFQLAAQNELAAHAGSLPAQKASVDLARSWTYWSTAAFLGAYWEHADAGRLLPRADHGALLWHVFLIERALFELRSAIKAAPASVPAIAGQLVELLESEHLSTASP